MKGFAKRTLNRTVIPALSYIKSRTERKDLLSYVEDEAKQDSARFVYENIDKAILFRNYSNLWTHCLYHTPAEGLLLEFGVFRGSSLNFFADDLKRRGDIRPIYGFDSFEGLEEDWSGRVDQRKGLYRLAAPPTVAGNAKLIIGKVQDTLPGFLDDHAGSVAFAHIDTDTYSPAKFILDALKPRLVAGSIVLFDELVGYPGWRQNEFKALCESIPRDGYEFIAYLELQAAIRITKSS